MEIISFTKEDFRKYAASDEAFDKIPSFYTINELVKNGYDLYKNQPAIGKEDGTVATYEEFYLDVLKVARYLSDNNVARHTNVGLVSGNNYTFAVMSLGIMIYGCVAVLIPAHLDEKTVFGCSMKYMLSAVVFNDNLIEKAAIVAQMNKIPVFKTSEILALDPTLDNEKYVNAEVNPSDDAAIIMTGGTTGRSKGALLSHEALLAGTINGCYGIPRVFGEVYYCLIPLTHVFGFIRNFLTSVLTCSTIYFNEDKRKMFEDLAKIQPTELVLVPALAELFLNLIKTYGKGFISARLATIICGAANVPPYLVREYAKFDVNFCAGYGLTEFANMVSGNPDGLNHPESVGMMFPDQEAKVVEGELWLRGRNQLKCYFGEDEENKAAFEDGWFKTGDLVRFDEHNNLYIVGRIKDVIVLPNGENVSPAYIEQKINELDFIQDSLVYETTNALGATILKLEVTLRQMVIKSLGLKEEEIQSYVISKIQEVNKTLIEHERVSEIVIRKEDFPRTPAMKIIRPKRMY